jgi:hypothetical protein
MPHGENKPLQVIAQLVYNCCMENEHWKLIPDFEAYAVSNLGNVRRVSAGKGTRPMRQLKPVADRGGRLVFNARKAGLTRQFKVHRAVLLAFKGRCPDGHEVAHLDGDQKNNNLKNLIYATPVENNRHKVLHGTQPFGSKVYNAKLTEGNVINIRSKSPQLSYAKIAAEFGVSLMTIANVITRKTWKHI